MDAEQFCRKIPKLELHVHLGGSVRRSTIEESLREQKRQDAEEFSHSCVIKGIDKSPMDVQMTRFDRVGQAWRSWADTRRYVLEFIEDCIKDNVIYVEMRTSGSSKEKLETILQTFHEHKQKNQFPIMKLVVSINRTWTIEQAEKALNLAIELKKENNDIVGLDFCDNPRKGTFQQFTEIFKKGKENGFFFTSHFAETDEEKDLDNILNSNPERLGHCCFLNPQIEKRIFEKKIPIEACLSSNINTMKLEEGITENSHPLQKWIKNKHPVVLCTDNPGILDCKLSDEYVQVVKGLQLSNKEIWELSKNSINFIFSDEETKQILREVFESSPLKL